MPNRRAEVYRLASVEARGIRRADSKELRFMEGYSRVRGRLRMKITMMIMTEEDGAIRNKHSTVMFEAICAEMGVKCSDLPIDCSCLSAFSFARVYLSLFVFDVFLPHNFPS